VRGVGVRAGLAAGAGPPSLFYPHLPDALGLGVCYDQVRLLWLGLDSGRDSWSGSSPFFV
jgi:hypothetical protein